MTLREKYGEWGIILGATEGVGKAFAEKIASEGMSVVLVGRREEKLHELGKRSAPNTGWTTKSSAPIFPSPAARIRSLQKPRIWIWAL